MGDKKTFSRPWMDRIPSRDMREHLKKLNYKFTDLQLATMICKFLDLEWQEQREWLRELAETTENELLHIRILEFLEMERKEIEKFKVLRSGWFYELEVNDGIKPLYRKDTFGYYDNYEAAWSAGVLTGKIFQLRKIRLQTKAEDDDEISEVDQDESSSYILFNQDGSIRVEDMAESKFWEKYNCREDDFMSQYFYVPTPFYLGDVVHVIGRDEYGVITHGRDEQEKLKTHEALLKRCSDESDIDTRVATFEDGEWLGHSHCSPFDVEFIDPERDDDAVKAMKEMGKLMRGDQDPDWVLLSIERAKKEAAFKKEKWYEE